MAAQDRDAPVQMGVNGSGRYPRGRGRGRGLGVEVEEDPERDCLALPLRRVAQRGEQVAVQPRVPHQLTVYHRL